MAAALNEGMRERARQETDGHVKYEATQWPDEIDARVQGLIDTLNGFRLSRRSHPAGARKPETKSSSRRCVLRRLSRGAG
jgi:hypothetical protein